MSRVWCSNKETWTQIDDVLWNSHFIGGTERKLFYCQRLLCPSSLLGHLTPCPKPRIQVQYPAFARRRREHGHRFWRWWQAWLSEPGVPWEACSTGGLSAPWEEVQRGRALCSLEAWALAVCSLEKHGPWLFAPLRSMSPSPVVFPTRRCLTSCVPV